MIDWSEHKIDYREFCRTEHNLPVFLQPWWLDVVCERGSWEVCLSKDKNGNILGVLPFFKTTYLGMPVIKMPDLTPYLGIWLNLPTELKTASSIYRFEKKVSNELIAQLPEVAYYAQNHPVDLDNWLHFKWKGFQEMTRYTFTIPAGNTIDAIWKNINSSVRNKIRKAEASGITIEKSEDLALFYEINKKSFARQSLKVPYTFGFIKKLDQALKANEQREILLARDADRRIHAAIYLVWDRNSVYNLMLGADTELRNSGAVQLLLWSGIKKASTVKKVFDFEGGMLPNIASVFSAFGAFQQPYHKIYKGGNRLFRFLSALKNH